MHGGASTGPRKPPKGRRDRDSALESRALFRQMPPGAVPLFSFGNSGHNTVRGPGINNVDLSIFKTFKFNERSALEFRTEFFNAFNHTQFLLSGNSSSVFGFTGSFGQLTQARDPRIIQFALKLSF